MLKTSLRIIFFLTLALQLNMSFAAENDEAAKQLCALLTPVTSIKAKFQQTVYNRQHKELQSSAGNFALKRPNMFRWQVESPAANLLITDGKQFWNYDVELEQVTVQPFNLNNEVSPLSFLFGDVANLSRDFTVHKLAADSYELTPKAEHANFVKLDLTFSKQKIKILRLYDHLGQTTVFNFTQVQNNPTLPDSNFAFTPPMGVDVIHES